MTISRMKTTKTRGRKAPTRRRARTPPPPVLPAHRPQPLTPPARLRPAPAELPRLLTVDEVADLLRTTRRAVYTRIRRGSIPGVIRLSRRLLIDGGALVEWIEARRGMSLTTQGDQR